MNGVEITTRLVNDHEPRGMLVSISITDEPGGRADRLEITIDDRDRFVSAAKGDEVRVWLGYEPTPVYMGRYTVESVHKSGPRRMMTISALAAEMTSAIRVRKSRPHHATTLGAIALQIATEHGLTPAVEPALASLVIEHIDQQTESDLAFMERLAIRSGAIFKVADGRLLLLQKGSKTLPSGEPTGATTIRPVDCESYEWESGSRGDHRAVVCRYRVGAVQGSITAGDAGADLKHRDRRLYGSKTEAEASARAQLGDFIRGRVSASIECERGFPEVFAESDVVLAGFDAEMDATYRVGRVRHTLDSGGFRTSIELQIGGGADG